MDSDLRAIVRSTQDLSDQNIQYFIYQILRGLKLSTLRMFYTGTLNPPTFCSIVIWTCASAILV